MSKTFNRRQLLKTTGLVGASWWVCRGLARGGSPNEKLDIAVVGVAGRGGDNLNGVAHENIVALCDVDSDRLGSAAVRFPLAKTYADFRVMLKEVTHQIDAVVVSTADHTHAVAGVAAMKAGKHCYCEKPMTHNVYEARVMTELAKANNLATQLGTQIHAGPNYRRAVELVQSGAIGPVGEVFVWLGANFDGPEKPQGVTQPDAPTERPPVPPNLNWDLWLGPAPERPYHPAYAPFHWRNWWAFANGQLGDFFCHYCDLAFWALDLKYPTTVEAEGPVHPESAARWTVARQEYPARGDRPPVVLHWHNGGAWPAIVKERDVPRWNSGVLFVGTKGMLLADYGNHVLLPESQYRDFERPQQTIPDSVGHHQEWINACKSDRKTTCGFDYSGPLTEAALLCNVALRTGEKLTWNAHELKAVNCSAAEAFLRREYRKAWTL
ncbi:MAG: Gfo/Idh/MocA family oxidoreductase [Planctomycetes bacterium]|nr:Gfo/Idh/MocA family oxidoreductase [Planctomycetota bacterium]